KEGDNKYAAVTYILKATLSKPDSSHSYAGPTVCQIQLPFSPLCLETFRDCPPHVVSSSHPIPPYNLATTVFGRGENRRRRSLTNVFWTSMGPRLDTTVLTPKIAVAAQPLDIKLSFDHNLMHFAARQLPPVILETLSIELVSETRARIPNASPRDPQAKWTEITFCCKLDAASIPVEQRSGMLTRSKEHRWDANLLVPELNAGLPVTPSFVTPSLSHAHTLRVRGQMDIDTEKIQFNVEKPLIVLSQYSREDPLAFSSKSASMSESDHVEDETSAPPPYTEASSGAITLPSYLWPLWYGYPYSPAPSLSPARPAIVPSTVQNVSEQDQQQGTQELPKGNSHNPKIPKPQHTSNSTLLTTSTPSLSIQAKPNLPEPYPWKVPGARSSQTLVFSRWGDELPFDDAREVIELGQTRISADMMIHHDVAMPRAKTWTVEAAQLFSMNDVGMDGMVHSEARRALEGLWSFGMQYGAYPECEIQLVDSLYTVHERGKFRLTKPVLGKAEA
ncbi:MAG: hypothetical protein Q9177_005968, partial [Variospora cf. flavescens]